jgi:hypothetical protein
MEIKSYVKIYDDVLPLKTLSNLIRYINTLNFEEAKIIGEGEKQQQVNFNIRKTYNYSLTNTKLFNDVSFSEVHWFCLLSKFFSNKLNQYPVDLNIKDFHWTQLRDITLLKYKDDGFYTWHTDHHSTIPRTMSCILLLNNDYEGGNLCFRNPDGLGEWEVEVKPNRMIIWPSNFLYPHTVKPVTKGIRYSIVAWAL